MIEPVKKPKKSRFTLTAEHMSVSRAEEALKESGLKGIYPKVAMDEVFTGLVHVRITATKVQANRVQKALWKQNGGAFCEIKRRA